MDEVQVTGIFHNLPKALYPKGQKQFFGSVSDAQRHAKAIQRSGGTGRVEYFKGKSSEPFGYATPGGQLYWNPHN